jgi:hypothetical protein
MDNNWYPETYLSAGSAENAIIRSRPCRLGMLNVNSTNAAHYLKLYDKATAPASGEVPKLVIYVPATTGQFDVSLPPEGIMFKNGLGLRLVTEHADVGTTAVTAGAVSVNMAIG